MKDALSAIANHPAVAAAIAHISRDAHATLLQQLELVQIEAPSGMEETRSRRFAEMLRDAGIAEVSTDAVFNTFGVIRGNGNGPTLMVAAHLDTVFPLGTDCTVKEKDGIYYAPGITDDTRGLAEILSLARAITHSGIKPCGDIILCGNAGEEGGFIGSKYIFENENHIDGFISIDGTVTEKLTVSALGGYMYRVVFTGTGGHASHLFGKPNANNALGRAIHKIADIVPPAKPRTIFNVGVISGGVAVNAIPTSSEMQIDMRSSQNEQLDTLRDQIAACCTEACEEENLRWNHPTERVEVEIICEKERRAYHQDMGLPLIQAAIEAYRLFGYEPAIPEGSSTDADVAMKAGVPAIAIGRGGIAKHSHTVNEQFDPTDAHIAVQRDLALILTLVGIDGAFPPLMEKLSGNK